MYSSDTLSIRCANLVVSMASGALVWNLMVLRFEGNTFFFVQLNKHHIYCTTVTIFQRNIKLAAMNHHTKINELTYEHIITVKQRGFFKARSRLVQLNISLIPELTCYRMFSLVPAAALSAASWWGMRRSRGPTCRSSWKIYSRTPTWPSSSTRNSK